MSSVCLRNLLSTLLLLFLNDGMLVGVTCTVEIREHITTTGALEFSRRNIIKVSAWGMGGGGGNAKRAWGENFGGVRGLPQLWVEQCREMRGDL